MVPYNEAKRLITTAVFEHDVIVYIKRQTVAVSRERASTSNGIFTRCYETNIKIIL